jgi:uncharacterized protein YegL
MSSLAGNVVIDDRMGPLVEYVGGSARPYALAQPRRLRWGRSLLPSSGITLTYAVRPLEVGRVAVNSSAVADYTDADGHRRQFVFPVPELEVVQPTQTPATISTATPTVTPPPPRRSIFLPATYLEACWPSHMTAADVVLAIDTSTSMDGAKLGLAKAAAIEFVGHLRLPRDQAAVEAFADEARLAAPLTGDAATLRSAIERLSTSPGTRIDRAINTAAVELLYGPTRNPSNRRVAIILSDGGHSLDDAGVLAAAREATTLGIELFAVGLGADVDIDLLRAVAGRERTFHAEDPGALSLIYRELATGLPCR